MRVCIRMHKKKNSLAEKFCTKTAAVSLLFIGGEEEWSYHRDLNIVRDISWSA